MLPLKNLKNCLVFKFNLESFFFSYIFNRYFVTGNFLSDSFFISHALRFMLHIIITYFTTKISYTLNFICKSYYLYKKNGSILRKLPHIFFNVVFLVFFSAPVFFLFCFLDVGLPQIHGEEWDISLRWWPNTWWWGVIWNDLLVMCLFEWGFAKGIYESECNKQE